MNTKTFISMIVSAFVALPVQADDSRFCTTWNAFVKQSATNVLLDFSYAGYNHGETAPPDVSTLGYTVYDVTDPEFGAVPNDGKSDRDALVRILKKIGAGKADARAIIYFPAGDYILHTSEDNTIGADGKAQSSALNIVMGHVILKGAGRDLTTLTMKDPNLPRNKNLYSSPVMISIRNNGEKNPPVWAQITGRAHKGDFTVEAENISPDIKPGTWVMLNLENNDAALVKQELLGHRLSSTMTNLKNDGVQVRDYHQVKSVSNGRITFYEPLMHDVDPQWGWKIVRYRHYEGVGIEDLTFVGNAKDHFKHHATWQDDGAYKPLDMVRMTDSWMRRVGFRSVSEAFTMSLCAGCSAYDITISGRRGHSAIRAQASSRVFIGKVFDRSDGYYNDDQSRYAKNVGQYHACGVSKQSIGCVIWDSQWGVDACFEAHATQPRATLFDVCKGGFMQYRMGGDRSQLPNHLDDLTLWNFNATNISSKTQLPFVWWDDKQIWFKTLPPSIVGFHGDAGVTFVAGQTKLDADHGHEVLPRSLYAAQLEKRLGAVPAWLKELEKVNDTTTGIVRIPQKAPSDNRIYDLNGRYVGTDSHALRRGIYIRGGKKLIK